MNDVRFRIAKTNPDDYFEVRRCSAEDLIKRDPNRIRLHKLQAEWIWDAFEAAFKESGLNIQDVDLTHDRLAVGDTWVVLSDAAGARLALTMEMSKAEGNYDKVREIVEVIASLDDFEAVACYEDTITNGRYETYYALKWLIEHGLPTDKALEHRARQGGTR